MELIQIIILIFALFALSRVFTNIGHKNFDKVEAGFWMIFWLLVIISTAFPEIVSNIAKIFGVGRGVDLVIYFSIVVLSYLIFRLYAYQSRMERNITKIIRTIAIKNENRAKS